MAIGGVNLGQELLNVPMGDMIRSIALAIADAQWALDKSSMVVTELMSGQRLLRDLETGELMDAAGRRTGTPTIVDSRIYFGYVYDDNGNRVPTKMSMMELGFVPTFYQFVDTIIEVKISITIQASVEATNRRRRTRPTSRTAPPTPISTQETGGTAAQPLPASRAAPRSRLPRSMPGMPAATTTAWKDRACCAPNSCRCRPRRSSKTASAS